MQGVDLYVVGQLLGHKTPRMTQRYAHLSPHYMAGAVGKLDSVFGEVMPGSEEPVPLLQSGEAEKPQDEAHYVTIASPLFSKVLVNPR